MSDTELEQLLTQELGYPEGQPLTDEILWEIIGKGEHAISALSHEEAIDLMSAAGDC